jgi:hypothetical protein
VNGQRTCYVLPCPTKQQLENAVQQVQAQLHAAGHSISVGAVESALAELLSASSLQELRVRPGDLAPIKVRLQWELKFVCGLRAVVLGICCRQPGVHLAFIAPCFVTCG